MKKLWKLAGILVVLTILVTSVIAEGSTSEDRRNRSLKHMRDGPGHSKAGHPESWPRAGTESKLEQPEEEPHRQL